MKRYILLAVLNLSLYAAPSSAAAIYTTDFIPDDMRSGFNGFESASADSLVTPDPLVYTEGGILVEQVGYDNFDLIRLTFFHPEGMFGWDPEGGDAGYTRITRGDGQDFFDVGFLYATEFLTGAITTYALYNDGALTQTGSRGDTPFGIDGFRYLGFGGGGFDEIRMWDRMKPEYGGPEYNAFVVDAIEMAGGPAVPEPALLLLMGGGAGAAWLRARSARPRRRRS